MEDAGLPYEIEAKRKQFRRHYFPFVSQYTLPFRLPFSIPSPKPLFDPHGEKHDAPFHGNQRVAREMMLFHDAEMRLV